MPHKLLCLSPENDEDLTAALAHELKLTDHESQQGTKWIGYPEATRGQLWLFSRDQHLNIFYISRNKNTVFVSIPEDHLLYGVLIALQDSTVRALAVRWLSTAMSKGLLPSVPTWELEAAPYLLPASLPSACDGDPWILGISESGCRWTQFSSCGSVKF